MPEFDKNAAYLWAIVLIGLIVPALLAAYALVRVRLNRARLERLNAQEDEA